MEKKRDLPVVSGTRQVTTVDSARSYGGLPMETKVKAWEASIDIAHQVGSMLVFAANVHAEGSQLRQRTEAAWEETWQRIALIDKEAAAEVTRLARALEDTQERTKQLQMITNLIATQPDLPEEICKGLRAALENLTQRG